MQPGREVITHICKSLGMDSLHCQICCFKSGILAGCVSYALAFRQPHRKKSADERFGE
jgi:hypothetical protein